MRSGFFISFRLKKESKGLKEVEGTLQKLTEFKRIQGREGNVRQLLEEEIREYKSATQFVKYLSYKSIVFLENKSSESSLALFYKLRASNTRFEYAQRIVPLEHFFRYDEKKIIEVIGTLDESKTYKIMYEGRLCSSGMKEMLFKLITNNLILRVSLTDPYYTIVTQAFKNYVGVSVVVNEVKNFNFSCV